ncbi:hypothetical protein BpHYR1_019914 [Brachionus plicatilis]|uniref:Uncharacterized protein n=1 Tax=Brachionus plicatilis TaxID=10195 RepID=A0A3M7PSH4_BRAPC|nr:hypothetical protein BpHYR1_019914 [Brachionus plicatilis]
MSSNNLCQLPKSDSKKTFSLLLFSKPGKKVRSLEISELNGLVEFKAGGEVKFSGFFIEFTMSENDLSPKSSSLGVGPSEEFAVIVGLLNKPFVNPNELVDSWMDKFCESFRLCPIGALLLFDFISKFLSLNDKSVIELSLILSSLLISVFGNLAVWKSDKGVLVDFFSIADISILKPLGLADACVFDSKVSFGFSSIFVSEPTWSLQKHLAFNSSF